jgi:hypothetical protein
MGKLWTPLEPFIGEDEDIEECHVLFQVRGATLIPEEVTHLLGVAPTRAWASGERSYSKSGKVRVQPFGSWYISTEGNPSRSVEAHCKQILDALKGKEAAVQRLRGTGKYRVLLTIALHTGGPGNAEMNVLGETMQRLAALCDDLEYLLLRMLALTQSQAAPTPVEQKAARAPWVAGSSLSFGLGRAFWRDSIRCSLSSWRAVTLQLVQPKQK